MKIRNLVSLLLCLTIFSCQNKERNSIEIAKKIIKRASELTYCIPDKSAKDNIDMALGSMTILQTDKDGRVQFSQKDHFILLIVPGEKLKKGLTQTSKTLFQFDPEQMERSGNIVIMMNEDAIELSKDEDGKACFLIHEFIHALQQNTRMAAGTKVKNTLSFPDEQQAWDCQGYIYQMIHPEILSLKCDCNSFKILITQQQQKKIDIEDPVTRSIILYSYCKDKFLTSMYDSSK